MERNGRRLRICLFCPDRHLLYDGRTPDEVGVGGGVTSRVRLARALARLGHQVTIVGNCPSDSVIDRVRYRRLAEASRLNADVLILSTTGGELDLRSISAVDTQDRLRIVWVGGVQQPKGINEVGASYVVTPSNFVRSVALDQWGVPRGKLAVIYNGVERGLYRWSFLRRWRRNPWRLAYVGYPDKGLAAALEVHKILRARDDRFELHVYGGFRLWGEAEREIPTRDGVIYHGLVGQPRLAGELQQSGFLLSLQATPEGFGMSVVEAMAAGCIVIVSPVGAFPEIVRHGVNGFWVYGNHMAESTHRQAASLVAEFLDRPAQADSVRRNAMLTPMGWDTAARAWEDYCISYLNVESAIRGHEDPTSSCRECGGWLRALPDGNHCTECGWYGGSS